MAKYAQWWWFLFLCSSVLCVQNILAAEKLDVARRDSCQPDTRGFDAIADDINKGWDEYHVAMFHIYKAHAVAAHCYVQKNDLIHAVNELNVLDGMAPLDDSVTIARLALAMISLQRNPKKTPAEAFTIFDEDWAYLDHHIEPCLKQAYFTLVAGKALSAKARQCKISNAVTIESLFQSNKTLHDLVRQTIPDDSHRPTASLGNVQ